MSRPHSSSTTASSSACWRRSRRRGRPFICQYVYFICTCVYTSCVLTHTHTHSCTHIHTHTHTHAHTHTHTHTHARTHTHSFARTHTHAHTFTTTHPHTHTHTHTHSQLSVELSPKPASLVPPPLTEAVPLHLFQEYMVPQPEDQEEATQQEEEVSGQWSLITSCMRYANFVSHFAGAFLKTTLIYLYHLWCTLLSSIRIYLIAF